MTIISQNWKNARFVEAVAKSIARIFGSLFAKRANLMYSIETILLSMR
jgi:hypothetical protein